MKKVLVFILLILVVFLLKSCINTDKPQNSSQILNTKQTILIPENHPPLNKNVSINNIDYSQSQAPIGKFGGVFVSSTIGEGPKTFNPWNSKDATSSMVSDIMFDGLVTTEPYTGKVIPKLAKSFELQNDKKTYIIHLRKGLKWSDGKEITADDVVFTWEKIIFGGFGNTSTRDSLYINGKLPSVTKIDKYNIKFVTPEPFAPFLRNLSVSIAPKHIFEPVLKQGTRYFDQFYSTTTNPKNFVTSGAYRLKEYVPAQRVIFEKNPNYYFINKKNQKLPYLNTYIVLIVGDINNQILKFEAKEIDILDLQGSNVANFKEKEKYSDYKIYNLGPTTSTLFLVFNLNDRKDKNGKYYVNPIKQNWFNDLNFRTAIDYALDRENIIFNIASGVGSPLYTSESLSSIFLNKKIEN